MCGIKRDLLHNNDLVKDAALTLSADNAVKLLLATRVSREFLTNSWLTRGKVSGIINNNWKNRVNWRLVEKYCDQDRGIRNFEISFATFFLTIYFLLFIMNFVIPRLYLLNFVDRLNTLKLWME